MLVVPTVAPSNIDQSKRQAVGNVISADKNTNQFFQFPDNDPQQKILKRKIPSISPLVGTGSRTHYSGRPKDPSASTILYSSQLPISPPSSTGSSASSSASNRISSGTLLQTAILSQEVDEQERFDISKEGGIIQSASAVDIPSTTTASLDMNAPVSFFTLIRFYVNELYQHQCSL